MKFKHSNCIVVFSKDKKSVLFCNRTKEPYKGLYNFVGGKVEDGEDSNRAAYRELQEETGISQKDIRLYRMMDITYYHLNFVLELYVGVLNKNVKLVEEINPLEWLSIEEDFTDIKRFAGQQNIAHIINVALEYPIPVESSQNDGIYIGIDGCKGGWIVSIIEREGISVEKYANIEEIIMHYPVFDEMLIDMVIGLQNSSDDVRPDSIARELLVIPERKSTIFSAPSRQAVYTDIGDRMREENIRALGKSLSSQTIAIIPKIREVDMFLQANPKYKNVLKESHPEVCFVRLKGEPIVTKKAKKDGFVERVQILKEYIPELSEELILEWKQIYKCNLDDIVDSLVLAVTARLSRCGMCEVIPPRVQVDQTGLKMQMVIPTVHTCL